MYVLNFSGDIDCREKGMVIKQLDVIFGDIFVDVDDELLGKKLFASDNTGAQSSVHPQEPITTMQPAEKGHSHFLTNFPEKVGDAKYNAVMNIICNYIIRS